MDLVTPAAYVSMLTDLVKRFELRSAYVSIRQHTPAAYVSMLTDLVKRIELRSAYVIIRQHTPAAYVSMLTDLVKRLELRDIGQAYSFSPHQVLNLVSIRQHTSSRHSIRQHTSAYVETLDKPIPFLRIRS